MGKNVFQAISVVKLATNHMNQASGSLATKTVPGPEKDMSLPEEVGSHSWQGWWRESPIRGRGHGARNNFLLQERG